MLLTKIELKNFLAYRTPPPVDLEGIGLACLSGSNGAGKSSLLDAVTWALWGRARASSDDDLIYFGQTEMSVAVEFTKDGQRYRVHRQRKKGGTARLVLTAWNEDRWNILNEKVRESQKAIDDLLKLKYEVFVNSAFLQQGRADSFTMMTPKDRKGVLKEILNLSDWGIYEDRAKKKRDAIGRDRDLREMQIRDDNEKLAQEPELRRRLDVVCDRVALATTAKADADLRYDAVKGASDRMRETSIALTAAFDRQRAKNRDLTGLQDDMERKGAEIERAQGLIAQKEAIAEGYAALELARQSDAAFRKRERLYSQLEKRIVKLRSDLDKETNKLTHECDSLRKVITKAERDAAQVGAHAESVRMRQERLATLDGRRAELDAIQTTLSESDNERTRLETQNENHERELKALRSRWAALNSANGQMACPTCGQPLNGDHREHSMLQAEADANERKQAMTENEARLEAISIQRRDLDSTRKQIENELRSLASLQAEIGQYQAKYQAAQSAYDDVQQARAELEVLTVQLETEAYSHELRAELAEQEAALAALGYDRAAHDQTQDTLQELRDYEKYHDELARIEAGLPGLQEALARSAEQWERWTQELVDCNAEIDVLNEKRQQLEDLVREEALRRTEAAEANKNFRIAETERGFAENAIKALEDTRAVRHKRIEERDSLNYEYMLYEKLVKAFGQNGVPAMIIESAIPELERETNAILSLISEGRMKVQFQMQKETKSGTVADTLDLLISDELGTRDYSLYSGGEAFRVNFAVRVALSKFLSRRSGSQLRTLFIDEGFGSQDSAGRERLVEAINRISSQFDLILVVTHVDELQDAFQKHLRVTKVRDGGSSVQLIVD